ncbi:MAG: DUF5036 family protein [Bacteroidaceae bacterium]|nr:DUF5036 family protein [Bacteroidaceae bacterium]
MRNSFLRKWLPTLFALAILTCFYACSEDTSDGISVDPDKKVPDPAGTIQLSMRNSDNGQTELDNIYIENENFRGHEGVHYFTSLGPVNGLGNVAHIPTSGWASSVAVIPGHGYVAYSAGDSYWGTPQRWYRIYVTDYIVSTSGGIIGAKVKYQAPFKGSDEVIDLGMKEITLNAKGDTIALPFKNSGVFLFHASTDCPQLSVAKMSTYDHSFLTNGIVITSEANNSDTPIEGTVTLTTLHGKKTTLKVSIAGAKPFIDVSQNKIGLDKEINTRTITISTNTKEWEAESSENWCTISQNGNQLTIRTSASTVDRTAVIRFKGFDTKITVHQSKYAVGDEFNEDGVNGVVGYIGDSLRFVFCTTISKEIWSTEYISTGATSRTDGEYNMAQIKKLPYWEVLYPAFYYCEQLNTNGVSGWYLPAIDELEKLMPRFISSSWFWSSTEDDKSPENNAHQIYYSYGYVYNYPISKNNALDVIAIHKF